MSIILEAHDLTVRYAPDSPLVLDRVNITVHDSERVALLGLNGSGKTTLLLAAAGLLPYEGSLSVAGLPVAPANYRAIRDRMGFLLSIPEDQIFFPRVIDDTAFTLVRRGVSRPSAHERARAMLEQLGVGYAADLSPFHLSHGQRQRVALAGALVSEPRLLLLDEPSASLDAPGRRTLATLLRSLNTTIVIATHDIAFARTVCTRYVVLTDGRISYDGTDAGKAEARVNPPVSQA